MSRTRSHALLNVFAGFEPSFPTAAKKSRLVFAGNIHPDLQRDRQQCLMRNSVALDTMNLWIDTTRESLQKKNHRGRRSPDS